MPRIAKLSKTALADHISPVFQAYGYEGASLSMLASAAGMSKASLYHHFPNGKQDMAAHVLGRAGVRLQQHILGPLAGTGPAADRLEKSLRGVASYYGGDVPVCLMNSLLLGEGTTLFAEQISTAVQVWQDGLATAYGEMAGGGSDAKWAAISLERIQGALVLCRVAQARTPLDGCIDSLITEIA
ncbi:MAG: TetR/AcrR family transcriptional regulator [Kordiimonadaceae bacterium]|nr:TetR/AcrR family transcriptional regulator [Kordiimonadaceae bacterium]